MGDVRVIPGDALDVLRADQLGYPHALGYAPPAIPDASIDAIVTDPPYGLEFMGKDWDRPWAVSPANGVGYAGRDDLHLPAHRDSRNANCRACGGRQRGANRCQCPSPSWDRAPAEDMRAFQSWCEAWAVECLRVLKPGGHLVAFGGTRTVHRLTTGIEDAGFEIRDGIDWLYGSGFPKSLDVSKAIDKAAGAQREVVGEGPFASRRPRADHAAQGVTFADDAYVRPAGHDLTAPATDDAARWAGWGTALKPAREPIVVARKPLAGTVAANVLAYGTGALNIDACRVSGVAAARRGGDLSNRATALEGGDRIRTDYAPAAAGRWPSNVVLSHAPLLDDQGAIVGDACAGGCVPGCPVAELDAQSGMLKTGSHMRHHVFRASGNDAMSGGNYERSPRTDTPANAGGASRFFPVFRYQAKAPARERPKVAGVAHPTVKPVDLMRWLVRLVTPPGGTVLDLFAGSGTTGEACAVEGFPCVLIEREADYLPLIAARLDRQRNTQPALL